MLCVLTSLYLTGCYKAQAPIRHVMDWIWCIVHKVASPYCCKKPKLRYIWCTILSPTHFFYFSHIFWCFLVVLSVCSKAVWDVKSCSFIMIHITASNIMTNHNILLQWCWFLQLWQYIIINITRSPRHRLLFLPFCSHSHATPWQHNSSS